MDKKHYLSRYTGAQVDQAIGVAMELDESAIRNTVQSLTDEQKQIARNNIDVPSREDLNNYEQEVNQKFDELEQNVINIVERKLDCRNIDFGLSSDNSSADNWHTYQDVAEGMFILVDNKYGQGQSIGVLLQCKDNMNHALNQVVISNSELLPTEENFSSHQDGIMFFKCRSWNTLASPEYAGAKNTWSEWHDINERITNDDIYKLFN